MNYKKIIAVGELYKNPSADYNPACFEFSEEEARAKRLWRDDRPMPTEEEAEAAYAEWESREGNIEKRRNEHNKAGLTHYNFIELLINNDMVGLQKFRNDRETINRKYPVKEK